MIAEGAMAYAHNRVDPVTRVSVAGSRDLARQDELLGRLAAAGLVLEQHVRRVDPDDPPSGEVLPTPSARPRRAAGPALTQVPAERTAGHTGGA